MPDGDGPKTKRGRTVSDEEWAAAKALYETGGVTNVSELARRTGISRNALMRRIREEQWAANGQAKEQLAAQAQSNVIDIATGKAIEALGGEKALEALAHEAATSIESVLASQLPIQAKADQLLDRALDRALIMGIAPESLTEEQKAVGGPLTAADAQIIEGLLRAVSTRTKDGRLINGLVPGVANVTRDEEEFKPVEQLVLVVRKPPQQEPSPETATA